MRKSKLTRLVKWLGYITLVCFILVLFITIISNSWKGINFVIVSTTLCCTLLVWGIYIGMKKETENRK